MARGASRRGRRWWQRWWLLLLVLPGIVLGLVGVVVFFLVFSSVPLPEDIGQPRASVVLDRDGRPYAQLTAQVGRVEVRLEDLPAHVPDAVLAAEDRRFREHPGVSATSILRAALVNVRAGEAAQGGSTITQQYVKNAVVGNDRTLVRKLREAALALKMEQQFTKDEILELYLNTIYWGRGTYGVEAAAQTYFGTSAASLSVAQAATLAAIIASPENLDPAEVPDAVARRQARVLEAMGAEGSIDPDTLARATLEGLPPVTDRQVAAAGRGAYYVDAVRRELAELVGDEAIFRGLTVSTEVDPTLQAHAENAVAGALAGQPFTGALVAVDPADGGVRALVGGPDPVTHPFNTAVRSRRQPGSAFKAFTLAGWLHEGLSPESTFAGGERREVPDGNGGTATVTNYGGGDKGPQTLRQATWTSTNTAYVDAQARIGADKVAAVARAAGIPGDRELPEVATLTLGVASVSPLDMASAYATFAAGGVRSTPRLVTRVVDAEGEVLYEAEPEREAVFDANLAYAVSDVLEGVLEGGTGRAADIGRPAAGKTGTTDEFRDAWFVGYTPRLAAAAWIGHLDNSPLPGITGGSVPAQVWRAFMVAAHEGVEPAAFPEPDLRGLEVVGPDGEPVPSESPTPTASPSGPDEDATDPVDEPSCPEGVTGILAGCDEPSESPSPSPTPTADEEDPSPTPEPSPSGEASPEPSPSGEPTPSPSDAAAGPP